MVMASVPPRMAQQVYRCGKFLFDCGLKAPEVRIVPRIRARLQRCRKWHAQGPFKAAEELVLAQSSETDYPIILSMGIGQEA